MEATRISKTITTNSELVSACGEEVGLESSGKVPSTDLVFIYKRDKYHVDFI